MRENKNIQQSTLRPVINTWWTFRRGGQRGGGEGDDRRSRVGFMVW